jgi:competence protein ComEC
VAGLIAYYFRIVTPIAVLANLVVVPLIAVIVALGMGLLVAGSFWPPLAVLFAVCIKALLNIMVAYIYLCVKVPGAYFLLDATPMWAPCIYYFFLLLAVFGKKLFLDRHFPPQYT